MFKKIKQITSDAAAKVGAVMLTLNTVVTPMYADGLTDTINKVKTQILVWVAGGGSALAIIMIVANLIPMMLAGDDDRSFDQHKRQIKRILVCYVLLMTIDILFGLFSGAIQGLI